MVLRPKENLWVETVNARCPTTSLGDEAVKSYSSNFLHSHLLVFMPMSAQYRSCRSLYALHTSDASHIAVVEVSKPTFLSARPCRTQE